MLKFTCGVNRPATYGLIMPGIVAIVFEMPNKMPEYGPPMSFIFTKWPAPIIIELELRRILELDNLIDSRQFTYSKATPIDKSATPK